MSFLGIVLVVILYILGFLSCFINKIPGPIICAFATLFAKLMIDVKGGWGIVAMTFALAIVAFFASKYMTRLAKDKLQQYSKGASLATTIGSLIGMITLFAVGTSKDSTIVVVIISIICGFIILPYLLAFLVEFIKQKKSDLALKSAGSATAVYLADTMLKLLILYLSVYYMFMA